MESCNAALDHFAWDYFPRMEQSRMVVLVGVDHASHQSQSQSRLEDHVGEVQDDVCDDDKIHPRSHVHNDVDACVEEQMQYSQELTHLQINPDWCRHCNTNNKKKRVQNELPPDPWHTDRLFKVGAASSGSSRLIIASSVNCIRDKR